MLCYIYININSAINHLPCFPTALITHFQIYTFGSILPVIFYFLVLWNVQGIKFCDVKPAFAWKKTEHVAEAREMQRQILKTNVIQKRIIQSGTSRSNPASIGVSLCSAYSCCTWSLQHQRISSLLWCPPESPWAQLKAKKHTIT